MLFMGNQGGMKVKAKPIIFHLPAPRLLALIALLLALAVAGRGVIQERGAEALAPALFGRAIILDAGHGGWDPGMKGAGGSVEQDINLAVTLKLAEYLRQAGALVMLTRENGEALAANKAEDMAERVALAAEAELFISLHCNSFVSDKRQHGAQVFFQQGNEQGQRLAETLQSSLVAELENNDRVALKHPDSYLLKNIDAPAVIVEMGFLSNADEEALLLEDAYQWRIAWALFLGIEGFFSNEEAS